MALLPPFFLDALVAFEQGPDDEGEFTAVASGVLIGLDTQQVDKSGEKLYRLALITNRHVLKDEDHIWVKFNKGDVAERFKVDLFDTDGAEIWRSYEDYDVAAIPINVEALNEAGAEFKFIAEDGKR